MTARGAGRTAPGPAASLAGESSVTASTFGHSHIESSVVHHRRHARTALGSEVEKNMSFLFGRRSRAKRTKLRPQLPCWCREHGSERARSKLQHHPQLCAKPPHRRLTARPPAASSLPTGGAPFRPSGSPSEASVAACPRPRRQVSAPGWSEKHPITAAEPARPLGTAP